VIGLPILHHGGLSKGGGGEGGGGGVQTCLLTMQL